MFAQFNSLILFLLHNIFTYTLLLFPEKKIREIKYNNDEIFVFGL